MHARLHVHTEVSKWMHKGLLKQEVAIKEVFLEIQGVQINTRTACQCPVLHCYHIIHVSE